MSVVYTFAYQKAGGRRKAALTRSHFKTWRTLGIFLWARSVLECVRASAALVLKQVS